MFLLSTKSKMFVTQRFIERIDSFGGLGNPTVLSAAPHPLDSSSANRSVSRSQVRESAFAGSNSTY